MRVKVWCIVFLAGLMVNSSISPLNAQSAPSDDLAKYYENCIVKKIYNCKGKTVLKTSRSVNLRRKADLAERQVTFFKTNKNLLIQEMVEQEIGPKPYKVEYYLNKRFFEMYR
jgi:hypothetical protein